MGVLRYGLGRPSEKNSFGQSEFKNKKIPHRNLLEMLQKKIISFKKFQIASKTEKSACFPVLRNLFIYQARV